jgi:hypothetical protein
MPIPPATTGPSLQHGLPYSLFTTTGPDLNRYTVGCTPQGFSDLYVHDLGRMLEQADPSNVGLEPTASNTVVLTYSATCRLWAPLNRTFV